LYTLVVVKTVATTVGERLAELTVAVVVQRARGYLDEQKDCAGE